MFTVDVKQQCNNNATIGAVAVNDLTHPRKTLYDKSFTFVHPPYSVSRSKNDFDYLQVTCCNSESVLEMFKLKQFDQHG